MMRDLARSIFHGSVLSDILDNETSLKRFTILGKSLSEYLQAPTLDIAFWKIIRGSAE
jgi:hypothetical protein